MRSVVVSEKQSFSLFSFKWSRKHFNNSRVRVGSMGLQVPCLLVKQHQTSTLREASLHHLSHPEFPLLWTW